ncbi:MAG: D-alanyl-D-alanine carboxypeptidase [Eubacterium sp.]|nr:D-alanyl-D-alanine carboxypeptidase [Eubacterium sp.]
MQNSRRKRRHNLARNMMIVIISIIMVLLVIIGYLYFNDSDQPLDLSAAYTSVGAAQVSEAERASTAVPFADDLCVSEQNVDLLNINFQYPDEHGLLFNLETKEAKFARGIYDRIYPASITKIMTAILYIKYANPDERVTITGEDVSLGADSQLAGFQIGDTVTMQQLFSSLLVYSANDAAMAIARQIGGDVDRFVLLMNEEARKLGMTGTHFVNPHGLHDNDHYTTPYDVYLMLNEASRHTEITDIMKNSIYKLEVTGEDGQLRTYNLDATDKYLSGEHDLPEGVTIMAGKTGTTDEAGSCLALAVQNQYGVPYIAVVMNAPNKQVLYADMDTLLTQTNA